MADPDIIMSLEDTLELDAVIKEWDNPNSIITDSESKFEMSGFHTSTGVLDPKESGTHKIVVNGQELTVKVNEQNTIPDSATNHWDMKNSNNDTAIAKDIIGQYDATATNSPTYNTSGGPNGEGAYSFSGNSFLGIGDGTIEFDTGTVAVLVNRTNNENGIVAHGWNNGRFALSYEFQGSNGYEFRIEDNDGTSHLITSGITTSGSYLWLIGAVDASNKEMEFWVDDVSQGTSNANGVDDASTGGAGIGSRHATVAKDSWEGDIAECIVFDKRLEQSDVDRFVG